MCALQCSCDWEVSPGDMGWNVPEDFTILKSNGPEKCCSCKKPLVCGDDVVLITRFKIAATEEEENKYGELGEVPIAPIYLCENCGGIYLSLYDAGYEFTCPEETLEALEEYWEITGFDPNKYKTTPAPVESPTTCP